ncbi:MAG TPA: tetratricopeptide repeat protein [Chroococcales cyanobacterium]
MLSTVRPLSALVTMALCAALVSSCSKSKESDAGKAQITPEQHAQAWNSSNQDGLSALSAGDLDKAEKLLLTSLSEAEACGPTDQRVAVSLNNLASVYEKKGMYDQCLPYLKRSRKILELTLPKDNRVVPVIIGNQARVLSEQGKYADAQPLYAEAVSAQDKAHSVELPDTMRGYAKVLKALKRDAEAKTMEEMAASADEKNASAKK